MELTLYRADPAGNVTLLVTTPVAEEDRTAVSRRLLARDPGAEQVGFLTAPRLGGKARLEMMGGEFCGNALRSAGYLTAYLGGMRGSVNLPIEISGCAQALQVQADLAQGQATAQLPLPTNQEDISLQGLTLGVVELPGIVHGVIEGAAPDRALAQRVTLELAERYQAPAAGLMFLRARPDGLELTPAVYVAATDTLYFEQSCASGSAAAACYLCAEETGGFYSYQLRQPGGVIRASTIRSDGEFAILTVGGDVTLGPAQTVNV